MRIHVIEPLAVGKDKMDEMEGIFAGKGHEIRFFSDRQEDPQVCIDRCGDADVVVIGNLPFPGEVIKALPNLKLLAVAFTGVDHVDMDACRKKGIQVCNASGYSTINVAELAVCFMIDLLRNVTRLDPLTRKGGTKEGYVGWDLKGKTVGIIGYGAIGRRVARLLKGFECTLIGFNGKNRPEGEEGIEFVGLDELMSRSDIVTIHCPLRDTTRGLIGEKELSLMKDSSFLVNCARGPIVDTNALYKVLKENRIKGAALDVFDIEPPLDREAVPMLELENVILTPHIAFATKEAFLRRADIVVDNILKWDTGIPANLV